MQRYLLIPMKRLISKLVPGATKSELGSPSQEPSPNGGQNCSPTNPLSPGQPVALWSSFIIHKTKAGSQLGYRRNTIDVMPYKTKPKVRCHFCRGLLSFLQIFERPITRSLPTNSC